MNYSIKVNQEDVSDTIEVSPFVKDEPVLTLSDGGWACKQMVLTEDGVYTVISKDVTIKSLDDLYFAATLEPLDTAILDVSQYLWVIEISNDTLDPKYRKETHVIIGVDEHRLWNTAETPTIYDIVDLTEILKVKVDTPTLAVGTIKSIKLLDVDNVVLQTIGYISDVVDDSQVVITLSEPVKDVLNSVKLMINI